MSLEILPYDVFFLVLKALFDSTYYHEYIGIVKTLRLTSRSMNVIATDFLFENLHLYISNPNSWMRLKEVLEQPILVENVRGLAMLQDWSCQSDATDRLSLASMPNLEKIYIEMLSGSKIRFRRLAKSPRNAEHQIFLSLDQFCDEKNRWAKLVSDLANGALAHGFKIDFLRVHLDFHFKYDRPFWLNVLPTLDLRHLRTLYLHIDETWDSVDLHGMTSIALPAFRFLPSLVRLRIDQQTTWGAKPNWDFFDLLQEHHWPSVRHIQIVNPLTTLRSLNRFLLLYQGQLLSLALYGAISVQDFSKKSGIRTVKYPEDYGTAIGEWDQVLQTWIEEKIAPHCLTVDSRYMWRDLRW